MTEPKPFLSDQFKWHESFWLGVRTCVSRSKPENRDTVRELALEINVLHNSNVEPLRC